MLGRGEADLRREFGDALRSEPIASRGIAVPIPEKLGSSAETVAPGVTARTAPATATKGVFAGQLRLVRSPTEGDVRRVEYELFRTLVYRVRWQLAKRFERPIMASLVAHLTGKLGKPYYDQLIEGKFGSGRATLRRTGWRNGSQNLEVRQLNPMVGGAIYLTLSDQAAIGTIVASGGTAAPEPDSIGRWWNEPIEPSKPLTAQERGALLVAFDAVLARVDWER